MNKYYIWNIFFITNEHFQIYGFSVNVTLLQNGINIGVNLKTNVIVTLKRIYSACAKGFPLICKFSWHLLLLYFQFSQYAKATSWSCNAYYELLEWYLVWNVFSSNIRDVAKAEHSSNRYIGWLWDFFHEFGDVRECKDERRTGTKRPIQPVHDRLVFL